MRPSIIAIFALLALASCNAPKNSWAECMERIGGHPGANHPDVDAEWCRLHSREVTP
jgi:hypothetical protein